MSLFKINSTLICKRAFQTKCYYSKQNSKYITSNVRKKFLDYFIKENNHKYVRSSSVMPYCDPTVAFVNAGMNQFKSIFLGHQEPMYKTVANSQKCIRVGGKHNDLNVVGTDGYHHTFFEMLGNWSFDDYFKKEACELAWNLLTGPYGLPPSSLYVTYFAGDSKLNLEPDLECRDIWRSIGIADDHILPFSSAYNFWEMGQTGPCGPCTEIHIDRTHSSNRSSDVNRDLPDLVELWNIVFIQYNRLADGRIELLPKHHIDTGMGLERLTAVLQEKSNNYDIDIFQNLFQVIEKKCKGLPAYGSKFGTDDINGIDTAYRILADHSRMITACLSDGMIPEENQKLRRILRKALLISETIFKQEKGLVNDLSKTVAQNLGEVYPEMMKNLNQVQQIIEYEEDVYKSIRSTATKEWSKIIEKEPKLKNVNILEMPGLVTAYNDLISSKLKSISPQIAFKLYDTYGLDEVTIKTICDALHIKFEADDLKSELELAKMNTKNSYLLSNKFDKTINELRKNNVSKTLDRYKYSYSLKNNDTYIFESVPCKVLAIVKDEKLTEILEPNTECYLVLDQTNFYTEAGGQLSDAGGRIEFSTSKIFEIKNVENVNGFIFHRGILKSNEYLETNEHGTISIKENNRLKYMSNHTATHLLNAALKKVYNGVTCQKSSKVTPESLSFDVGIYGKKLTNEDIENIENMIRSVINKSVNVNIKEVNSQQLLSVDDVTVVPGEIYPDVGIRLIEIQDGDFLSREPCCGTHVLNTSHIKDFCIINQKSLGRSTTSLVSVTGDSAKLAHANGENILNEVLSIEKSSADLSGENSYVDEITELKQKLNSSSRIMLPVYVRGKCMKILNNINKQLRDVERDSLRQFIDLEMKSVLETNCDKSETNIPYIVHYLGCSSILDNIPLQRATKICSNYPVIVISYSDEIVKARCCVPQDMVKKQFNAEIWLSNTIGKICKSPSAPPKGQNGALVCNMKAKRINKLEWETILDKSIRTAKKYANKHL